MIAATHGHTEVLRTLIRRVPGMDALAENHHGATALHTATTQGTCYSSPGTTKLGK
jgi:hypothetical protein